MIPSAGRGRIFSEVHTQVKHPSTSAGTGMALVLCQPLERRGPAVNAV